MKSKAQGPRSKAGLAIVLASLGILASALWLPSSAQTVITADGLAAFGTNAPAGGGGGGGGSCTPSYSNPTGVGITVFGPGNLFLGQGQTLPIQALVTNNVFATGLFFNNGLVLDGSTYWIGFDFGSPALATEDVFFQSSSQSQGIWKWQGTTSTNGWVPGSNDGSIWTDIGGNFTLATQNTTTNTAMSANTTKYRFYRALGMSGSTSFFPWTYQFQFKYCQ